MSKLTNCKSCEKEIAKGVKRCPHCGKDNRNFFFKHKVLTGIAALLIIGAIASAGTSSESKDVPTNTNVETAKIEYTKATMDQLTKALNDNPLKASSKYKDTYLELSGKVSNIDAQGKYFSIKDSSDFSFISTQIFIDKEFVEQVADFSNDQDVVVKVKITDVGEVLGYSADLIEIVK